MDCTNCIHYDVCDYLPCETINLLDDMERRCEYIKDKSRFVELPCKLGDTVYRLAKWDKGKIVEFTVEEINIFSDEINIYDDSGNSIYKEDIGRTVFLTRKEAETRLKVLDWSDC